MFSAPADELSPTRVMLGRTSARAAELGSKGIGIAVLGKAKSRDGQSADSMAAKKAARIVPSVHRVEAPAGCTGWNSNVDEMWKVPFVHRCRDLSLAPRHPDVIPHTVAACQITGEIPAARKRHCQSDECPIYLGDCAMETWHTFCSA